MSIRDDFFSLKTSKPGRMRRRHLRERPSFQEFLPGGANGSLTCVKFGHEAARRVHSLLQRRAT
jgi:hypothetical protein